MTDITIIGTGYVGLVAAIGLSDFGNRVVGADIDPEKIERLKKGIPPIYEPGIEEYLRRNLESKRLSFTTEVEVAVRGSDVVFLAVGTPPSQDGSADLSYLYAAADTIADNAKGYTVVITKSTVPVGTNRALEDRIRARNPQADVDVVSNPEFLREGKAVQDFFHPDRTVVGTESERAKEVIRTIYRALNLISVPFVWCNRETAELIKYASNAFLATKITFINEMANLAEAVGADIHAVAKTMGMDGRISPKFLHPGPGYGGSCFPKDTKAIASTGDDVGVDMSLIKTVIEANERQKKRVARVLEEMTGSLSGLTVAILGLAFKAETDDVRDSPALTVVADLLASGASVRAHDPQAAENFRQLLPDTQCFSTGYEAVEGADAVVLMTEWNEYRSLDLDTLTEKMKGRVVLDARNLLDPAMVRGAGFTYRGTGRGV
ncbi:MAG: UDP-glucose/GDP-mannose dehydrogenase family protein [Spirochaetaceae bacterium]|nr:UDP-glucose/GDP-mannose dehydrogenase family protein [Spirochaetaceae bacterium]